MIPSQQRVVSGVSSWNLSRSVGDPILALSVAAGNAFTSIPWALAHRFAIEYTPDPAHFDRLSDHMAMARSADIPVRFHGRFYGWEIGHPDDVISQAAMRIHRETLQVLRQHSPAVVTFHLHLCWEQPFDVEKAVANLSLLVEEGKRYGITVCIENLREGEASHPENICRWAERSGARITLDVGHALSCSRVRRGELDIQEFIDAFSDRLEEVHMYGYEADRHYPVTDVERFTPIVQALRSTGCPWWTIELSDPQEILSTRNVLLTCMKKSVEHRTDFSNGRQWLGSLKSSTEVDIRGGALQVGML